MIAEAESRLEDAELLTLKMQETTSQGMQVASRSWKRRGICFHPGASGRSAALPTPWFLPGEIHFGLLNSKLEDNKFAFEVTEFLAICYGRRRKLMCRFTDEETEARRATVIGPQFPGKRRRSRGPGCPVESTDFCGLWSQTTET